MTRRQLEVFDWIAGYIARERCSPTFEEIAAGTGVKAISTVHAHIDNLVKAGKLRRTHASTRSLEIVPPAEARIHANCAMCAELRREIATLKLKYGW